MFNVFKSIILPNRMIPRMDFLIQRFLSPESVCHFFEGGCNSDTGYCTICKTYGRRHTGAAKVGKRSDAWVHRGAVGVTK